MTSLGACGGWKSTAKKTWIEEVRFTVESVGICEREILEDNGILR